jgi:hypothetical protein
VPHLTAAVRSSTRLITLKDRTLSPVARLFIKHAREVAKPLAIEPNACLLRLTEVGRLVVGAHHRHDIAIAKTITAWIGK